MIIQIDKQLLRLMFLVALALCLWCAPARPAAQEASPDTPQDRSQDANQADNKPGDQKPTANAAPKEETSTTDHTIRVGGQSISYKATASTTLLKNEKDEPTALIFTVAYTKSDVKDSSQRPIAFLYNGGPGSASVWLHMGAFGPRRVKTPNAEPSPPPPYDVEDNANSLLDKTDLVFIDPVGTGYSRAVGKSQDKDFWGIDSDVKSIAQFINLYVTKNNRWNSPKFLIGESYGTFRSAALSNYLQSNDGMYLNGIVLLSTVLDLGTLSFNPGEDMPYIFYLPSYAATAWYHKLMEDRPSDLNAFLDEARKFASTEYASALMKGSNLPEQEKTAVVKKLARFTGLSEDYIRKADLRVSLSKFMAELQRSRGLTTGRLDARFSGSETDLLAEYASYDPLETAVTGPFTAAFNRYVREELKFSQERKYEVLNDTANEQWDWKHHSGRRSGFPGSPNVEGDLVEALVENPHLHLQVENGFFDLATPFFATEYTMDHLELPQNLRSNISLEYYDAGHMMYLRDDSLAKLKDNIATFLDKTAK
jgi:carboxypeptidase C (cathepsin A)